MCFAAITLRYASCPFLDWLDMFSETGGTSTQGPRIQYIPSLCACFQGDRYLMRERESGRLYNQPL